MKKILFLLIINIISTALNAQSVVDNVNKDVTSKDVINKKAEYNNKDNNIVFGYCSYTKILKSMPQYAKATLTLNILKAKYEEELKRAEREFNYKYEQFLECQKNFAQAIKNKRQAELLDLMHKNIEFKQQAIKLMEQAEEETYLPLKNKINEAVNKIGKEKKLYFVLNTDIKSTTFINSDNAIDITADVLNIIMADNKAK